MQPITDLTVEANSTTVYMFFKYNGQPMAVEGPTFDYCLALAKQKLSYMLGKRPTQAQINQATSELNVLVNTGG